MSCVVRGNSFSLSPKPRCIGGYASETPDYVKKHKTFNAYIASRLLSLMDSTLPVCEVFMPKGPLNLLHVLPDGC